MAGEAYSLGYGAPVLGVMGRRTAENHAAFFLPRLQAGWNLLDAGCGPGTITLGLARAVRPGRVVGIDIEDAQTAASREIADREGLAVEFRKANVYELPFADGTFDAVFSHALLTHLNDPAAALAEMRRVLKPGGILGVRTPDMDGHLIDAPPGTGSALLELIARRREETHDPQMGRKLGRMLRECGFRVEQHTASYEMRTDEEATFVALAWCEAIGVLDLQGGEAVFQQTT